MNRQLNIRAGNNIRFIAILTTASTLLLIPFVAMFFTREVNWSIADFVVAAVLLFGTGFTCELVMRKVKTTKNRIIICGTVLLALFLIWAELAVGVFGTVLAGS